MALDPCGDCGQQISTEAVSCPHCGRPRRGAVPSVSITNIDMPFFSMVNFMAKAIFAAIPAALVVAIIVTAVAGIFAGLFHR